MICELRPFFDGLKPLMRVRIRIGSTSFKVCKFPLWCLVGWLFNGVIQCYGIATTAIFFYEYLAMLPDEVRRCIALVYRDC